MNQMVTTTHLQEGYLGAEEAAEFLNISKSHLYKLTFKNRIPYYKPGGKLIYFKREELSEWVKRGRVKTLEELEAEVDSLPGKGKRK
ncbi:MAG: helix-turn-helix domain-containing protein [Ignavibacteriales bacterium]|nr:MAG: helix-turn-helix domain-containing protein [Ignavibacteriales bacterium]